MTNETNREPGTVWVERTGTRTYTAHNGRGDEIKIGQADEPGRFSPGELLKIALLGCAGMSTDFGISRRLGDDYETVISTSSQSDEQEDRFIRIDENFELDLSGIDEKTKEKLFRIMAQAVDAHCTIARTVTRGAELTKSVNGEILPSALHDSC